MVCVRCLEIAMSQSFVFLSPKSRFAFRRICYLNFDKISPSLLLASEQNSQSAYRPALNSGSPMLAS